MGPELSHLEKELDRFAKLYIDSYLRAAGLEPAVAGLKSCATPTVVPLNYEEMEVMYTQHGTRGVYAYLIERGIAKDKTHGDFLIEDIFLPEYTKRHGTLLRLIK